MCQRQRGAFIALHLGRYSLAAFRLKPWQSEESACARGEVRSALDRQTTGRQHVEIAHMELAPPSIADAVGKCAVAGARKVVVAPYFLSRGRHITEDIPALVASAQADHPGVQCVVADPIGASPPACLPVYC